MSDKELRVADCDIAVIDGRLITLHNSEEYIYGCSMTVNEWQQIKTAVDRLIAEGDNQ